jgi:hypothetical protein
MIKVILHSGEEIIAERGVSSDYLQSRFRCVIQVGEDIRIIYWSEIKQIIAI